MSKSNETTVTPENMDAVMKRLLDEYAQDAFKISQKAAQKAARQTRSVLKATKHARPGGKYARGWTTNYENKGTTQFSAKVHNKLVPGLPHLLNDSHAVGRYRGGHYEGDGEVNNAERIGVEIFMSEVEKAL